MLIERTRTRRLIILLNPEVQHDILIVQVDVIGSAGAKIIQIDTTRLVQARLGP